MRISKAGRGSQRTARIASLLAILPVLLAACGGAQSRFADHMKRGDAYYAKGEYTQASLEFRNAMQIDPKNSVARVAAGRAAEKLGQFRNALGLYQAEVDANPQDIEAHAGLGRLLVFGGAPQRAVDAVDPAIAKHPEDASLLVVRGSARMQLGNGAGAIADADRALSLAPDNEDAISLRAGLYQKDGDANHAIELVAAGVQRHPQSKDLREVLANLYSAADQPAKVAEQLQALIHLQPDELRYRKELAVYYSKRRELDNAQRVLETAVKDLPKNADAKLNLVRFISSQRSAVEGQKVLREFIAKDPGNYPLQFGLADLLQQSGSLPEALATYNTVIKKDDFGPNGLFARDRIATIYLAQGRDEEARKVIKEVLDKSPRDTEALYIRGEMALKGSDPAAAVADLRAVLRDQPQSVPVQRLLARAYLANGDAALAEQALRAAMDVDSHNAELRIELAQLLSRTARLDQAVSLLEETVRADPTDERARQALINAQLTKRDFAAALVGAKDLETLRPDSAAAPLLAGLALQGQNRLDDARHSFERALEMKPGALEALSALTRMDVARGNATGAIALINKSIAATGSKDANLYNLLGEVYLDTKDLPRAIEALGKATKLAPNWWPAYRNLAIAKSATHDIAGSIADYQTALKLVPTESRVAGELAQLYEAHGRADDAISIYEDLHRRQPRLQIASNNLAILLVTYKKDRASLDRARDLTADFVTSGDGSLLDTHGWVRVKRGEYAEALPVLERAAERAPEQKQIRYHLAVAELHTGQKDRARMNLQSALSGPAKFPWSDDARQTLAQLGNPAG